DCGTHQFYARPFCLACESDSLAWVEAAGTGSVYSATTIHVRVRPELDPPYDVALVELDEGPRMLSVMAAGEARIGDRVRIDWREREDAPPLPNFVPEQPS
ncbi:MAG: Zn-ribbon domain-containing OB-fold protein, partial [Gaiellaceae bacterium]